MSWLTSSWSELGITAGKAALMYATALIGLRLGERRTLAQWTLIDYVAAVAVGAIVGRTATASTQYLLYEVKGGLTIVPTGSGDGDLVTAGLRSSAGHRRPILCRDQGGMGALGPGFP